MHLDAPGVRKAALEEARVPHAIEATTASELGPRVGVTALKLVYNSASRIEARTVSRAGRRSSRAPYIDTAP